MALLAYQLRIAGPMASSTKEGIIPVTAKFVTTESPIAVEAAGYFNGAAGRLPKGSVIDAVMSHGGTPVYKTYVVTSNDGTTVAVGGETDDEPLGAVARAVVPTADGLTTGLILATDSYITVTSAGANDIITLPAIATVPLGKEIWGKNGAIACEMRTPALSNTPINGTDADNTEAVIAANVAFMAKKVSATDWALLTLTGGAVAAPTPD